MSLPDFTIFIKRHFKFTFHKQIQIYTDSCFCGIFKFLNFILSNLKQIELLLLFFFLTKTVNIFIYVRSNQGNTFLDRNNIGSENVN